MLLWSILSILVSWFFFYLPLTEDIKKWYLGSIKNVVKFSVFFFFFSFSFAFQKFSPHPIANLEDDIKVRKVSWSVGYFEWLKSKWIHNLPHHDSSALLLHLVDNWSNFEILKHKIIRFMLFNFLIVWFNLIIIWLPIAHFTLLVSFYTPSP